MADGFARVTNGKPPGVFMMQYGPGSENAFPGIATTFSDSVPRLFLPLAHARDQSQIFPTFSSSRTYASVTKQVEEIIVPEATTHAMRRAFNALKNGRPGPVMVEVPRDIVALDAGDDAASYRPMAPTISATNDRDVDEAAERLLTASHPMILAGQGVLYRRGIRRTHRAADLLQAPVMTTVDGKVHFPKIIHWLSDLGATLQRAGPHVPAHQGRSDLRDRLWLH